jgi:protein involved in polysaccharide export with SLBB domain
MDQVNRIKWEMQSRGQKKAADVVSDELRMRTTSEEMMESKSVDEADSRIVIFGHRIFRNRNVAFEASYNLPTPSDYKLGPGDQVAIDVWGASQSSLLKTISPDGNISVDNLGPIYLSGLTVDQANNLLKQKFETIYSGLNDENPISNIRLSLAQNRAIQVHVMGEVINPGTYTMSSFATIFNALYLSGGVNDKGTLRAVKVYRKDKPIATYDVYDFILNGNSNMGIRLEDNDIVVVDTYKKLDLQYETSVIRNINNGNEAFSHLNNIEPTKQNAFLFNKRLK